MSSISGDIADVVLESGQGQPTGQGGTAANLPTAKGFTSLREIFLVPGLTLTLRRRVNRLLAMRVTRPFIVPFVALSVSALMPGHMWNANGNGGTDRLAGSRAGCRCFHSFR
jgi:hypothetical protein